MRNHAIKLLQIVANLVTSKNSNFLLIFPICILTVFSRIIAQLFSGLR